MAERFFPADDQVLQAVLDWSYQRIVGGQDPMTGARSAVELDAALGGSVTPEGIGGAEALRRFTQVIVPATRAQGHPMNLAYVPSAPTPASLGFDLAVSAAEIFGGLWEAGAGAIHAENEALRWLTGLAGWPPTSGGTFVQGGTIGNLSALVAARHRARSEHGDPVGQWAFAATRAAHSSVDQAAAVMDVAVCDVEADDRRRMTGPALDRALDAAADRDETVFAVVASAGTTNSGAVDDLHEIADVCEQRGLWLHVDGAYGLAAMAAPSVRHLFDGIERADSFVVDPHKWLFAPYDCCALAYREPALAARAHSQRASYLANVDRAEWNPSDYAIQLTRRARGLPLWFSLAAYGTDRYGEAIEQVLRTSREIADGIEAAPHLEVVVEPQLSVILFRRPGWTLDAMRAWSHEKARTGVILCLPTEWGDEPVFRLCIVSPDTSAARVLGALDTMR